MIEAKNELANFKTIFSNSNYSFYSDHDKSKGGNSYVFRPDKLLETVSACCMNMWIRMYADNYGIKLNSVVNHVTVKREIKNEVIFEYNIICQNDLTNDLIEKLYCVAENSPVRKTLSKKISFKKG